MTNPDDSVRKVRVIRAFQKTVQYAILGALEVLTPDEVDGVLTDLGNQLAELKFKLAERKRG